jgi:hypothetical protein
VEVVRLCQGWGWKGRVHSKRKTELTAVEVWAGGSTASTPVHVTLRDMYMPDGVFCLLAVPVLTTRFSTP